MNGIVDVMREETRSASKSHINYIFTVGTVGTGTIQGNTDFHRTDDHDGSLTPIKLLEREASKTF